LSEQTTSGEIVVRGARLHNLKNLTLSIPHNKLSVVTGVSGSGKSSLAFDTIYAEGQRRYVESLSAYARQFLERMEKPEVDEIDGIAPAIAIRQKNTTRNPRSTVATSTEIYDFMRLLWARAGRTFCPVCGRRVERDTVDQVAQRMLAQPEGERFFVLFPVKHEEGQIPKLVLTELRGRGFNRLWQNGTTFEFSTPESLLDVDWKQPVYVLADRIAIGPELHQRIVDTVEVCYREAGDVIFHNLRTGERQLFSERFMCKYDNLEFREPEPILFSFNSPAGACPRCQGFGNTIDYSLDLIIPNRGLSLNEGAVEPWTRPKGKGWLAAFRKQAGTRVRYQAPFCDLTEGEQKLVIEGDEKVDGVRQFFNYLDTKKYKLHVRVFLSKYRGYARCPDCGGSRLRKDALNARVGEKTIADAVRMNIADALAFFSSLQLSPEEEGIAGKILVEIEQRLRFLNDVGLEYLTLDRLSATLSGGEAQRIQLATCLGSRLVGACYVLDEPSIGLHSRDTARLIRILWELRDLGNTILVVEHDPDVMRSADHIIDLGPGAGEHGGSIVFEGDFAALSAGENGSLTGRYLRREVEVAPQKDRREVNPKKTLRFFGARLHNLKSIDVSIPLRMLTVVTGVSGSGKSTLVHDVIYKSLQANLQQRAGGDGPLGLMEGEDALDADEAPRITCSRMEGADAIHEVVMIDQTPIGRTPRSNPITYIKGFDIIRSLFSSLPAAEKRGYTAGHFSFNVPGGRCEVCQGDGTVTVEMQFLADVELVCDECKGTRFKSGILDIKYKGLNVNEVLQLTVAEAIKFFHDTPRLVSRLRLLDEVGLGYLRLGQSATTLSGGEAQRVKLAAHLSQSTNNGTLFICDEPTTGLHFDDIRKLLASFERLIDNGGSLLVIEHNLDVIRAADWIIDMGPEGGEAGGRIVGEGPPEEIAKIMTSHTGRFLRNAL